VARGKIDRGMGRDRLVEMGADHVWPEIGGGLNHGDGGAQDGLDLYRHRGGDESRAVWVQAEK
jgi:hypothetical protein